MRRRLTEITIVILGILIGAFTNVATGALPDMLADWKQYLWLAWLPLAVFVPLVVVLEWRASRAEPAIAAGDTVGGDTIAGDKLDMQGAQGVVMRPAGAVAQTNVTNSGAADASAPRVQSNVAVGDNTGTVIGTNIGTQIINQALAATALHQLRAPVGDFVGREREIDQLVQALGQAAKNGVAAAISGVRGLGGIGKTELAYVVVQRLADQFPDAQILVELRGSSSSPVTPEAALQTVIRAFERESKLPDQIGQLQALYRDKLSGKRVLILADDAGDAAQVRSLLPPAGCALLVTSRNWFSLPGMAALDLGTLPPEKAAQLLREICPRIAEHAGELARLCGYLPLALRVSGGLLANSPRQVALYRDQLQAEGMKHLRDPDDPQASVEASLQLSYDALEPHARMAICQLSVFPISFDLAAAVAVVALEGEEALELLRRRSLLDWDESLQRFSLHDLVRVFAASRLADVDAVRLRHARHYAGVAAAADNFYLKGGASLLAGLALFDLERAHIDAGWGWARAQAGEPNIDALLLEYANATAYAGDLRYDMRRERIPQLEAQHAAAQRLGRRDAEGAALGNLGAAYKNLGDARQAIDFHKKRLVIARESGDRRGEGNALGNLGNAYADLGDARQAISFHEQRFVIAREIGDRRGEGNALGSLGSAYFALGNARQAINFYEQALAIVREIGDRRGEGNALGNLGNAYADVGDARQAIAFQEQRLVIAREIGDRRGEGQALGNLGNAYYSLGDARQAIGFYEQHLMIAREIGDRRGEGAALGNLGNAYADLGDARQAIDFYERRLMIAREIGDRRGEGVASWNLGLMFEKEGDLARAAEIMQVCVDFEREIGHPDAEADATRLERLQQRIAGGDGGTAAGEGV